MGSRFAYEKPEIAIYRLYDSFKGEVVSSEDHEIIDCDPDLGDT